MTFPTRLRWLVLTFVVVTLDRLHKNACRSTRYANRLAARSHSRLHVHSSQRQSRHRLQHVRQSESPLLRISLITLSFAFITVLAWLLITSKAVTWRTLAGLSLLIGGAAGNLTDRLLHGAVTDFFELWFGTYRYPAFNVADSAITSAPFSSFLMYYFRRSTPIEICRNVTPAGRAIPNPAAAGFGMTAFVRSGLASTILAIRGVLRRK